MRRTISRRFGFLLIASVLAITLLLGTRAIVDRGPSAETIHPAAVQQEMEGTAGLEAVQPSEELVAKHPFIYAGIHLDKIYELNLNSRTFTADGEIWLEWLPEVEELLQRYDTDPADLISLTNRIETWDSTFEPSAAGPRELSGGRRQLLFRFSSRFYDDAVDFRRDPFDVLKVPIIIELEPLWTSQKYADLRLLPAPSNDDLVGELGSLSGYQLQGASFKPFLRRSSNSLGSWYRPQLSQVRLEVTYQSNLWPGIVNWIIPLMIINSIVLMAPSVEGTLSDVRLAIPSTALLTLIFLQQSYHSSLPKLPYTTFLDDLFTTSYLIAMALFGLFTWGYNVYVAAPDEQKASTMRRINQADMRFQYLSLGLLVLTAVISWGRR
ncbi:hypothetical protein SynPROS71_00703 [Synechococcus sp. PROS-7-1]|uniref:hypothetical protein n=1 Tax=Synechococcus sp. PROS-7-1 TaxID=1442556 RepID=UPI001645043E|nr:hypothetical protein [Synechococcus sp. PROS-7-1]QNI84520.1 hypothetical protein SynPROS71_00703 [Synechococcus sp. PROS-7-1]